MLNNPNINIAHPNAKKLAFIRALFTYGDASDKTVILMITAIVIRNKAQNSIKHTKRYLPFTTSFLAIGSKTENTISLYDQSIL